MSWFLGWPSGLGLLCSVALFHWRVTRGWGRRTQFWHQAFPRYHLGRVKPRIVPISWGPSLYPSAVMSQCLQPMVHTMKSYTYVYLMSGYFFLLDWSVSRWWALVVLAVRHLLSSSAKFPLFLPGIPAPFWSLAQLQKWKMNCAQEISTSWLLRHGSSFRADIKVNLGRDSQAWDFNHTVRLSEALSWWTQWWERSVWGWWGFLATTGVKRMQTQRKNKRQAVANYVSPLSNSASCRTDFKN